MFLILVHKRKTSLNCQFWVACWTSRPPKVTSFCGLLVHGISVPPYSYPIWPPMSSIPIYTNTHFCPGAKSFYNLFSHRLPDGDPYLLARPPNTSCTFLSSLDIVHLHSSPWNADPGMLLLSLSISNVRLWQRFSPWPNFIWAPLSPLNPKLNCLSCPNIFPRLVKGQLHSSSWSPHKSWLLFLSYPTSNKAHWLHLPEMSRLRCLLTTCTVC